MELKLRIAGIDPESIVDGPGVRTVLFLQGCARKCPGCHNPSTWPMNGGEEISVEEVLSVIKRNTIIKGVTFSGGEPFLQAEKLLYLAESLKKDGYEIACYTGYLFEEVLEGPEEWKQLLSFIDVLINGPFIERERSMDLKFRGSSNQRIIDVQESLRIGKTVLQSDGRWG